MAKNGTIDLGKGKPIPFCKWEDIDRAIRPLLAEEGFALSFTSAAVENSVVLTAILTHSAEADSFDRPYWMGAQRASPLSHRGGGNGAVVRPH